MLGTITGDIIGSFYEKANYKAKDFTPLFHPKARFTDDTVCTVAIADALLSGTPPAVALQTWGSTLRAHRRLGSAFCALASRRRPAALRVLGQWRRYAREPRCAAGPV